MIEESNNCTVTFESALHEASVALIEMRHQLMLQGVNHLFTIAWIHQLIVLRALHFSVTCLTQTMSYLK